MIRTIHKIAIGAAVVGAVGGYAAVSWMAGASDCPAYSFGDFGLRCGLIDGLIYRFTNFMAMLGAMLGSAPGVALMLWTGSKISDDKSSQP